MPSSVTDSQVERAARRKHQRNIDFIVSSCEKQLSAGPNHPMAPQWKSSLEQCRGRKWEDEPDHMREQMLSEIREILEDGMAEDLPEFLRP